MEIHIYAPSGYFHIQHDKWLGWFDLTGWHEPNPVLWRKKYERIEKFVIRCRQYVTSSRSGGKMLSHKEGMKILMRNVRRDLRIQKQIEKQEGL